MNNDELLARIEALEKWKADRERQQVTFPLDVRSIEVLNKYFTRVIDSYTYFGGVGDNTFPVFVASQDGNLFDFSPGLVQYTAKPADNTLTVVNQVVYRSLAGGTIPYNQFFDDETVVLFTSDTMPGGLSGQGLVTYYVVDADSDGFSFKLSATLGGAAIDITTAGAGRQLIQKI